MSISFFVEATGIDKKQIKRALDGLITKNVLIVTTEATFSSSRIIAFNKDYDQWEGVERTQGTKEGGGDQLAHTTGGQLAHRGGDQLAHQEKKVLKKDKEISNSINNPFEIFQENGFGTLGPIIRDDMNYWIDEANAFKDPEAVICFALTIAAKNNKKSWAYAEACLINWQQLGLKTMEDINAYVTQREGEINANEKNRGSDRGRIEGSGSELYKPQTRLSDRNADKFRNAHGSDIIGE